MLFTPGSTRARKMLAAGVTAGFAAGTALLVVPAGAASGSLNYDCNTPTSKVKFTVGVDTDAPDTIAVGQSFTPKIIATVNADSATTQLLRDLGAATIEGATKDGVSTHLNYVVSGAPAQAKADVPLTKVPASGPLVVKATATGASITPTATGPLTLSAHDFTAVLAGKNAAGDPTLLSPYVIGCTIVPGQNVVVDTVNVVPAGTVTPTPTPTPTPVPKVDTKTKVKAKYIKRKRAIKAAVKVVATDGKPGTGKVKLTLSRGKKKIKSLKVKLSSAGTARAVFKRISKRGKYKLTAVYRGSATQNGSKGRTVIRVR